MWAAADSAPDFDKTKLVTVALLLGAGSALALGLLPFQAGAILLGLAYGAVGMLRPRWLPGLLVLVAVLLCWEAAVQSSRIFGQGWDTWLHLGLIRRVLEHGPYPPDTNYLGHSAAPHTSLTHYIQATAWWITSLPGHTLWRASSPVVVACLAAISYFAHRELLRDRAAAALASVFYLSQKFFAVGWAVYPRVTAPALYLLTIGLLARGLRTSRPRLFLMAGLALGLTFGTHPVTGVMAILVVGSIIAIEGTRRIRRGELRALAGRSCWLLGGAAVAASAWVVGDLMALSSKTQTAPIHFALNDQLDILLRLKYVNLVPNYGLGPGLSRTWPLLLWAGPLSLGAWRALRRPRDPILLAYLVAAFGTVLIAVASPLTPFLMRVVGATYVARFVDTLPLAALAGLGLASSLPRENGSANVVLAPRIVAGSAVALCIAAVLYGLSPWDTHLVASPRDRVERPELSQLEPLIHERVVLTDKYTAYVLPYFTGAFVVWTEQNHLNPWIYDEERAIGTKAILAGKADIPQTLAFCDKYAVDFILLRRRRFAALGEKLVHSGHFARRDSDQRYFLLERL